MYGSDCMNPRPGPEFGGWAYANFPGFALAKSRISCGVVGAVTEAADATSGPDSS